MLSPIATINAVPARLNEVEPAPNIAGACRWPLLARLCWSHRGRLALTYALFNVENSLDLTRPWLLGLTIAGLMNGRASMVLLFAGFCLLRTVMGVLRRMYDTRTFLRMYSTLATDIVVGQSRRNVRTTRIVARTTLAREATDFLERDVPVAVSTMYSVAGGVIMLGSYDRPLMLTAATLGSFGVALNILFSRRATLLNRHLNDTVEEEVDMISRNSTDSATEHYARVANCQIRISDWQAGAFSVTQGVILSLFVVALYRVPHWNTGSLGDVYALFRYVTMFTMGLASVPQVALRLARLRDIQRRFHVPDPVGSRSDQSGPGDSFRTTRKPTPIDAANGSFG